MKLLLDTHILLWAAAEPEQLSSKAKALIEDPENQLYFSAASLWEISIKNKLGRTDFKVDLAVFRRNLLDNGFEEIAISSAHANGAQFSVADGSVRFVSQNADGKMIDAIADRDDGATISWD